DIVSAIRIVVALRHFFVARSHLAEIAPWLDIIEFEASSLEIDPGLWARFLNCKGTIAFYRAQYDLASACFLAALTLAGKPDNCWEFAYALDGLGVLAVNSGDLNVARRFSQASLELSTAVGDHWLVGITRMNLGEIARMEGDITVATAHYLACLGHLQLAGDPYFIAVAEINLAQVYLHQGDLLRAEAVLHRALTSGLQAESVQVVTSALEKLAGVLCERHTVSARHLFSLAQRVRQASGVTVQPVDRQDYAQLAAQLQPLLEPANGFIPFAEDARIDWRSIQTAVQAILEQRTS
ncbi:MAG: hypothetical protein ACK4SA_25160, partial [Caldilinea sp.]